MAQDDLPTYVAHELDNEYQLNDDEPTIFFDQIADIFQQQDDYGVRQVHPTKRSLSIIASRCNIIQQNIPECKTAIPNITDIPNGISNHVGYQILQKRKNAQM